jgi:cobalt-zinc-cadmium efflux system membrane fusion protein
VAREENGSSLTARALAFAKALGARASNLVDALAASLGGLARPEPERDAAAEAHRLSRQAQLRYLIIGGLCVVALFGALPFLWNLIFSERQAETAALVPGYFRPTEQQWSDLTFEMVRARPFPGVVVTEGSVATNDDTTTPVFSPYSDRVTRIIARLGDRVRRGDPLMTIAATEAAQSQNDLIAAVDALNAAKVQETVANEAEQRQRKLYLGGSVALKDWQQSQSDLAAARAAYRTAQAALTSERNKLRILGVNEGEISRYEKARAIENLSPDVTVFAPIDGTVIQRQVGLGQYIQAGASSPVYSIGNLSTLWLIGNVREADAPSMVVGAPIEIRVMALPGEVFQGKLGWIAPSIDPTTHRLAVRADILNPGGILKPTMFATVFVHTGNDRNSPAVPESAVIYEGEQARVWIARNDKTLGLRPISIGRSEDGKVEVLAGLKPGEKIVTSGAVFIDRAAQPE